MRIRTTKKMRLDELLKNVWDGNLPAKTYASDRFTEIVNVKQNGVDFSELKFGDIHKNTTYTVEVEEELTEETVISGMTGVYYNRQRMELDLTVMQRTAIKYQLGDDAEDILLAIYVGPTLIWSKEQGIPESGVLEVDVE